MNKLSRTLLLVGALVLALLVGLLIGRGQRATPTSEGNAAAVQITTTAPMAPAPTPLPAPVQAPQPVAVQKVAPDLQVQEDAAAVGMTTRDDAGQGPGDTTAATAPKSAAVTPDDSQPQAN
jgi:hypothetical protein